MRRVVLASVAAVTAAVAGFELCSAKPTHDGRADNGSDTISDIQVIRGDDVVSIAALLRCEAMLLVTQGAASGAVSNAIAAVKASLDNIPADIAVVHIPNGQTGEKLVKMLGMQPGHAFLVYVDDFVVSRLQCHRGCRLA